MPAKQKNQRVTLKTLAEATGHSLSTVAQVLNTDRVDLFRPETRDTILDAANRMGYQRNQAALAMRTGKTSTVAFLTSFDHDRAPFNPLIMTNLCDALSQHGKHLIIREASNAELVDEKVMPLFLRDLTADGLLINYHVGAPERFIRLLHTYNIPSVWLNTKYPHNAIYPDEFRAGEELTRHLIEKGHRKIAFAVLHRADMKGAHFSLDDRYQGYCSAMKANGLKPEIALNAPSENGIMPDKNDLFKIAENVIKRFPETTAYIGYNIRSGHYLMTTLFRANKRCPEDVEIAVFHDNIHDCPSMTVSIIPHAAMAKNAVQMLMELIDNPGKIPSQTLAATIASP